MKKFNTQITNSKTSGFVIHYSRFDIRKIPIPDSKKLQYSLFNVGYSIFKNFKSKIKKLSRMKQLAISD